MLPACYGGTRQDEDMPVPGLDGEPTVDVLDVNGRPVTKTQATSLRRATDEKLREGE